jgi:hypothetical protein
MPGIGDMVEEPLKLRFTKHLRLLALTHGDLVFDHEIVLLADFVMRSDCGELAIGSKSAGFLEHFAG